MNYLFITVYADTYKKTVLCCKVVGFVLLDFAMIAIRIIKHCNRDNTEFYTVSANSEGFNCQSRSYAVLGYNLLPPPSFI